MSDYLIPADVFEGSSGSGGGQFSGFNSIKLGATAAAGSGSTTVYTVPAGKMAFVKFGSTTVNDPAGSIQGIYAGGIQLVSNLNTGADPSLGYAVTGQRGAWSGDFLINAGDTVTVFAGATVGVTYKIHIHEVDAV